MAEVLVSKRAEADYAAAYAWYAERSQKACRDFESEFERSIDALSVSPRQFPKCEDAHRFCLLKRFPYQLIFREIRPGNVLIVAIGHTSRLPD